MKRLLIILITLMFCLPAYAENLIMLAGGTGTQAAGETYPGVVQETVWDAGVVADFVGTNGAAMVDLSGDLTYATLTIAGDFSAATVGMYAYVTGLTSTNDGYFEITTITGTTSVTIDGTNLAGTAIAAGDDGDTLAVLIGGAAAAGASDDILENCSVVIVADIDLSLGNNLDVLFNKDETVSGAVTMAAGSALLGKLRFIGTVYDGSVVNNNFQPLDETSAYLLDSSSMPTVNMQANVFEIAGTSTWVEYKHINWTGTSLLYVVHVNRAGGTLLQQCVISNTSTAATAAAALYVRRAAVFNSKITSTGTQADQGTVKTEYGEVRNCYIFSSTCRGIDVYGGSIASFASGNLIVGGSGNTNAGIYMLGLSTINATTSVFDNVVYGFDDSIYLVEIPDIADYHNVNIYNNILWGNNGAGSYGIYNTDFATKDSTVNIFNNFIGNVTNEDNFSQAISSVSLTAYPFTTNPAVNAADFWLNDTAGGGALIKNEMVPKDFDINGTQDNFQAGAIQEASPSTSTGGQHTTKQGGKQ